MDQRLVEFLGAKQAKYDVLTHAGAVTAQEQAALTHTPGRAFAKVVVVKERDGFVLAVVPATARLDLDRLKGLIRHGEVRAATVEEIGRVIPHCVPGAIPPFGALFGLPTYVDRALADAGEITMPAGDLATAIRMRVAEFRRLSTACIGDFAVPESLAGESGGVPRARPARGRRTPVVPWARRSP